MPVLVTSHDGRLYRDAESTYRYERFDLDWSGLPADVNVSRCYWKFDVSREKGSTYARWYEYGNASNYGVSGMNADGLTFDVTNVTGTSGTARIHLGSKNGYTNYTNVSFNIEYAYKQSSLTLSASSVEAGNAVTARISAQSSTATHELVWKLGTNSATQTLAAGVTSSSFTVPLAWLPSAASGTATCTLTTLENGEQVGDAQTASFTVTVNASVIPSCTVSAALVNGFNGLYLSGRSSVTLTIGNAAPGTGAGSIVSYKIAGNGYSKAAQTATFGPLNAGTYTFTATVTDSRGRTGTAAVAITVNAYAAPTLSGVSIYRSNSGGTASESGGYAALKATAAYTALNGANALTLRGRYRSVNGSWSGWTAMTSGTQLLLGGGALSATASYEAQIQAVDTVGNTASYAAILPTASVTFNLKEGGTGAAFGKYAEGDGLELAAGWGFHRNGRSLTPAPRNLLDNSDFTDPVNQRGATSYTGTAGMYGIDRWTQPNANIKLTVGDGCISVYNADTSSARTIQQRTTALDGYDGDITAAVLLADGTILCGSCVNNSTATSGSQYLWTISGNGKNIGALLYSANGYKSLGLNIASGATVDIVWAALYKGSYTVDTLPEYVPKGKAAELAECQRYYYRIKAYWKWISAGICTSATEAQIPIHLPAPMRTVPTVTIPTTSLIKVRCGVVASQVPSAINWNSASDLIDYMQMRATVSGATSGDIAMLYFDNAGVIEFSADL